MRWKLFLLLVTGLRGKAENKTYKWKWHDELRYRVAMWLPV